MSKHKPLGKNLQDMGIHELLNTVNRQNQTRSQSQHQIEDLQVDRVFPSRYQARQHWDQQALRTLTQSIQSHGVLQPIVVREMANQQYELIAGERRWRASKLAGLRQIPAIVRKLDDQATMLVGLVENLQREQLNVMDQAEGYLRLVEDFGLTHEQIALLVGKSRSSITNMVRLCQLDKSTQERLNKGSLDMGHARCLLALPEEARPRFAEVADREGWSVRQTEQAVRDFLEQEPSSGEDRTPRTEASSSSKGWQLDGDQRKLLHEARQHWEIKLKTKRQEGQGSITVSFDDAEVLERLLKKLAG